MGGRSSRNSGSGASNKLPALDLNSSTQGTAGGTSSRTESARSKSSNVDEHRSGDSTYTEHRWSGSDRSVTFKFCFLVIVKIGALNG